MVDEPILDDRSTPYSYHCNRCSRCCHDKRIPLSPYDLIRLSEVLKITTTELIARHTDSGVLIKAPESGTACIFLGPTGCQVHTGRPAACRVYPLGRIKTPDAERFCHVQPHPQTEGVYAEEGTIHDYLLAQEVQPYFDAIDAYMDIYNAIAALQTTSGDANEDVALDDDELIDVDAINAAFCAAQNRPLPTTAADRLSCHLEAVQAIITRLQQS